MTNVILPKNTHVDIYAATGITVGKQIQVTNITNHDVTLYSTASTPVPSDDHVNLSYGRGSFKNDTGDVGAWALCIGNGAIDVVEVETA